MTREEQAIEHIKKYRELDEKLYNTAPKGTVSSIATKKCLEFWDMAIQALSQEPTEKPMTVDEMEREYEKSKALFHKIVECEDAISRDMALEKMADYVASGYADSVEDFEEYSRIICQLPSVTQKSGKWIEHPEIETSTPEYLMFYECSECGDKQCFCKSDIHKKRFCSNCGARMVEPQESEG